MSRYDGYLARQHIISAVWRVLYNQSGYICVQLVACNNNQKNAALGWLTYLLGVESVIEQTCKDTERKRERIIKKYYYIIKEKKRDAVKI